MGESILFEGINLTDKALYILKFLMNDFGAVVH